MTDRIRLTASEFWHDTPSADRLLFNWLAKCYLAIIAACGIPTLLFLTIPYMPESLTRVEIDPLHFLIAVAIIGQIYYRIKDKITARKI